MVAWNEFFNQVAASSIWEWLAVLTGVLYVIFAARKMIICWLFAIISSALYIYIRFTYNLYVETILQVFYLIMGFVGWALWNQKEIKLTQASEVQDDINRWTANQHLLNIVLSLIVAIVLGYLFKNYTDQVNPYADAFTTTFSLAATYMVTKKVLENWLYWIVIDAVSIYLYSERGLYLSAVLFGIFTILAVIGFVSWKRKYERQLK